MAQVKGIVAEVDGNKCVIITPDGQFLRVNKPSKAVVGQEVEARQTTIPLKRLMTAMVAILVLSLIIPSFNVLTASAKPVAYLSLDINPSLDLGINKDGNVVSVKGFNPEGQKLASDAHVEKTKVYDAVQKLVDQAIKDGYISNSKSNLIMAAYTGGTPFVFNEQQLKSDVTVQIKAANVEAEIVVIDTDLNSHNQASSNDISQGKYKVYEAAKAKGKNLSLQELKEDGIKNTLNSNGVQVSDLLTGVAKVEMKGVPDKLPDSPKDKDSKKDQTPSTPPDRKTKPKIKKENLVPSQPQVIQPENKIEKVQKNNKEHESEEKDD